MKKIISLIAIIALVAVIFTFAACGDKTTNDIKNDMTDLKDEGSSMMDEGEDMMDEMGSALDEMGDDLTEGGNVTDSNSSTGLFEDMTSDKAEAEGTADTTTVTNAAQ